MCGLFGMVDYKNYISLADKNMILRNLAEESEERGIDASGIAYCIDHDIKIYKHPLPAAKLNIRLREPVKTIIGHTRMKTQGTEKFNYNNHPWKGRCENTAFALAHNGVLNNDRRLRREENLPNTKIETDSFAAVQLLEKYGKFTEENLTKMAEKMEGTFTFTILDDQENLFIVKGSSPIAIYHSRKKGIYLYASTEEIFKNAVKKSKISLRKFEKIEIKNGDIIKIEAGGKRKIVKFKYSESKFMSFGYYPIRYRKERPYNSHHLSCDSYEEQYLDYLLSCGGYMGVDEDTILELFEMGMDIFEIESLLYSPELVRGLTK